MKGKSLLIALFTLFTVQSFAQTVEKIQNYKYTFDIKGATDTVYLANYFGKQLYYADTAYKQPNGQFTFEGEGLYPGKFAVVFPGKTYFELIINEPTFSAKGDTSDLVGKLEFNGSEENKTFYEYINFISSKKKEINPLTAKYREEATSEEEKDKLKDQISAIDESVKQYQKDLGQKKELLIGQIINMSVEIEIPEPPMNEDGTKDSTFQYYYYRDHFFDNVNFDNDAIVRCPSYHNKIQEFFTKVVLQHPDTINKVSEKLFDSFDPKSDVFKYTVNFVFNHFNQSKVVGMDGVFAYIGEKYYMTGKAHWADSSTVAKITERVNAITPTLVGKKAPPIILFDTTETRRISLYNLDAEVTVLVFWSNTCGHCKKVMPKLKKVYDKYKDKNVEVFAVGTELENAGWKKFIKEHNFDWVNVSDKPEEPHPFRSIYDIYATPKFFILDKDKKIFVKGIGVGQVEQVLKQKLNITDDPTWVIDPEEANEDEEEHNDSDH